MGTNRDDDTIWPTAVGLSVVDALLAAGVVGSGFLALALDLGEGGGEATPLSYLVVGAAGVLLLRRRRWPLLVLGLVAVARVVVTIEAGNDNALLAGAALALFTVARSGPRRRHLVVAGATAVALAVVTAALGDESFAPELLGELALLLLPVAVADAARSRADRVAARIEAEAEARVQAERLRIARDLHDVVAHGLSTIAVQSGVAAHLLDREPARAREALEIINRTGRDSLQELRAMVGVLRSTDEAPLRPTPSDPDDLGRLLDGAAAAGVPVTASIEGAFPPDVSDRCVVAVHRIIQEALTNVARHAGPVPTELRVRHGSDEVVLTVVNARGGGAAGRLPGGGATANVPSSGVGIVGMTERAESVGGTVTAEPSVDGGFAVTATVPYRLRSRTDRTP